MNGKAKSMTFLKNIFEQKKKKISVFKKIKFLLKNK